MFGDSTLFVKVAELLAAMIMGAGVAAWLFRDLFTCATILVGFVVSLAMIFVMNWAGTTSNPMLIFPCAVFFGASVGFDIIGFAKAVAMRYKLDEKAAYEAVGVGLVVTGVTTLVAAFIGMSIGVNLQGLQVVMFGLLMLILLVGVVALFVRLNKVTEMLISFGLAIFWAVYMVIDFNAVAVKANTWANATGISMKLFLDMVNFIIQIIKVYLAVKKK